MSASTQRLLARIGRWPRRIAALVCLFLAAATALLPHPRGAARPAGHRVGAGLHPGEVAIPVPILAAAATDVRPGAVVGVLAAPAGTGTDAGTGRAAPAVLVADGLRVLSVHAGAASVAGDANTVIVIATDRAHAMQLARYAARPLVLILDGTPLGSGGDGRGAGRGPSP